MLNNILVEIAQNYKKLGFITKEKYFASRTHKKKQILEV